MPDKIIWDYTLDNTPQRTDNVLLQSNATALYTRTEIQDILAQLQASDIPDISATYAEYVPQSNIYYVGKHGANTNVGTSIEQAFLTFSEAMSNAVSGDAIVCFDNGTYNEGLTCKDGVNIFAPNATLKLDNLQLIMATATVYFDKITRDVGFNAMVEFSGATGRQKLITNVVDDYGSNIAIRLTFTSIPILDIKELYVSGGGIGIADFTNAVHFHGYVADVYANSNNAICVQINGSTVLGELNVQHIVDLGFTNTIGVDCNAGRLDLICNTILCDTAIDIEEGATLNLVGCTVDGTIQNDGTLNGLVANNITDDNIVINPSGAIVQRVITPGTATTIDDGDYGFDRWKVLSEITNSVQIQRIDGNTQRYAARLIQNDATAQQIGTVQYIEGINCKHLRSNEVTISGSLRSNASITVKAVIVQWNSTEDVITNDLISTYGATVTLASNFTKAGTEKSISLAANVWKDFSHTVTLNSSFNNLCVLFYITSDVAQNTTLDYEKIKVSKGKFATPFVTRDIPTELALCQRYCHVVAPGLNGTVIGLGAQKDTRFVTVAVTLPYMRVTPTFSHNVTGWNNATSTATGTELAGYNWVNGNPFAIQTSGTIDSVLSFGEGKFFGQVQVRATTSFDGNGGDDGDLRVGEDVQFIWDAEI
jgi:hypothetical protein